MRLKTCIEIAVVLLLWGVLALSSYGQAANEVALLGDIIQREASITSESLGPVRIEWKAYESNEKSNASTKSYCFVPFDAGLVMYGRQSIGTRGQRGIYQVVMKNEEYSATISAQSKALPQKAFHVDELAKMRFARDSLDLPEARDTAELFRTVLALPYFRPGQAKLAESFQQWRTKGGHASIVKRSGSVVELKLEQWPAAEDGVLLLELDVAKKEIIQLKYTKGVSGYCRVLEHTNVNGVSFPSKFYSEFQHPESSAPIRIESQWSAIRPTDIGARPEQRLLTFYRLPEPSELTCQRDQAQSSGGL